MRPHRLTVTARFRGSCRLLERHDVSDASSLAEVEFAVPNMCAKGAPRKISAALRAVPGVREVKPKVPQKHVLVHYERKKDPS